MALFMACGMIGTRNLYVVRRSSTCVSCCCTLPMTACPPSFTWTCSTRTTCCPPVRSRRRTSTWIPHQTSRRRSEGRNVSLCCERRVQLGENRHSVCVQAIWTASAPSISSFGAAASIIASAPFMASSEIPPQGERHADCIWNNEAFTKSLDVVPRALLSRRHQFLPSPSGGCTRAILPSLRNTLTRTGGRRCWPATRAGELYGLFIIGLFC